MQQKNDLLTGEKFIPKRINQRFITPANRIKYYNQKANELRHKAAVKNKPLHKNLLILNSIMANQKEKVFHRQFLLGMGYNFLVNTHVEEYEKVRSFAIYEYIIVVMKDDQIKIIRK